MTDPEATKALIDAALETVEGSKNLRVAVEYLEGKVKANRFNTARAVEIFVIAIENAVWSYVKNLPMNVSIYSDFKASGLSTEYAKKLTDQFKRRTGATDQRRAWRFLRGILGA